VERWMETTKNNQTSNEQWETVEQIMRKIGIMDLFIEKAREKKKVPVETVIEAVQTSLQKAEEIRQEEERAKENEESEQKKKAEEEEKLQKMKEEIIKEHIEKRTRERDEQKMKEMMKWYDEAMLKKKYQMERKSIQCTACRRYGHSKEDCRRPMENGKYKGYGNRNSETQEKDLNKRDFYLPLNCVVKKQKLNPIKQEKMGNEKEKRKEKHTPQEEPQEEPKRRKAEENPTTSSKRRHKRLGGSEENEKMWDKIIKGKTHQQLREQLAKESEEIRKRKQEDEEWYTADEEYEQEFERLRNNEQELEFRAKEEEKELIERTKDEQEKLKEIMRLYPEEIKTLEEIDRIEYTKHTQAIIETKGNEPTQGGTNRIPQALQEGATKLLKLYEKTGVIRESTSEWRNRVFVKSEQTPDGKTKLRLLSDMTLLNDITRRMNYEIPDMKEILEKMQGSKYFSIIDLKDGYFQIKLREEDRHKTAFRIMGRTYEYCSMPMGYMNAPMIFQKMMDEILGELIKTNKVAVYMDDIVIYTKTEKEHMETVKKVMDKLKENNLRINIKKTRLERSEVKLLGLKVNGSNRKPIEMKRNEALRFPKPETAKEMHSFMGKMGYYRDFIQGFAILEMPLRGCMEKAIERKENIEWTQTAEDAYVIMRQRLRDAKGLILPHYEKKFILTTDACDYGLGAVLEQETHLGEIPITFMSKALTQTERGYGITEKELYAIVWSVEKLQYYLKGRKFHVRTDHKALLEIRKKKDFGKNNGRITRWLEKLSEFDFTIEYKPGNRLIPADVASRIYKDRLEREIEKKNRSKRAEKREQTIIRKHTIEEDGKQYWLMEHGEKREIPEEDKRKGILRRAHDATLHKGTQRIIQEARKQYYWRGMWDEAERITKQCETCIVNNRKRAAGYNYVETTRKLELVGLDIMKEEIEGVYILVMIDYYTRAAKMHILKNRTTEEIKVGIGRFINNYGTPEKIITDNAKELTSREIEEYLINKGIEHERISVEAHTSNGRVERLIRTIREAIVKLDRRREFKERMKEIEMSYNSTWHSAIKMTPNRAWENEEEASERNKKDSKYGKTFKHQEREKFYEGEQIKIAKHENLKEKQKSQKGRFYDDGVIMKACGNDAYIVKNAKGQLKKKTYKEIKGLKELRKSLEMITSC
ncbi:hypothetical protein NEMIN01_2480, partial [Nematocida minor]|uniref:uncharacterized protein n=1 Tax=Nematocida minor TaxID=1912983 RepID=UPI0022207BAF